MSERRQMQLVTPSRLLCLAAYFFSQRQSRNVQSGFDAPMLESPPIKAADPTGAIGAKT